MLAESEGQKDKPLILGTKQKKLFVDNLSLDQVKDEARRWGFNVIYIIDKIEGPVKEKIYL